MTDEDSNNDIPAATPDDFAEESNKMDQVVATPDATYILKTEERRDTVAFYDAVRRSDQTAFRIEFDKCDAEGVITGMTKRFEMEATLRSIFHLLPTAISTDYLLLCTDLGAHSPWKFIIFLESYISVAQYLNEVDKEDSSRQLMHRLAVNAYLGIQTLHKVDIVHGDIRPENMFIGASRQSRTVKIANFEHATSYNKEIPRGAADLSTMVYASRGRMRNYEGCKKDDIESWLYFMAALYHTELVPWHPDCKFIVASDAPGHEKEMLKLKRAFCSRKLWKAAKEVLFPEFDQILALMMKVTGRGEVPYEQIWNCLNSANIYIESNILGPGPWVKTNPGATVTPSPFLCTPIDNLLEDYVGKDIPVSSTTSSTHL